MFKKAERTKLKGRIALDGPSGSGKTYSALRAAFALGKRIAVIDTEHQSASKYAGENPDGTPWEFDVCELTEFGPDRYAQAVQAAGKAGYDVIVIDSLSHAWTGEGGALDLVDRKSGSGNKFTAWRDVTPLHRRMIDSMLSSPAHVIATMRTQTEYVLEPNEHGKMIPRKIGTKPIQREGMEYEFDVVGDLDYTHTLTVSKSRCPILQDAKSVKPNADFWLPFCQWLNSGVEVRLATPAQIEQFNKLCAEKKLTNGLIEKRLLTLYGRNTVELLTQTQADDVIGKLSV